MPWTVPDPHCRSAFSARNSASVPKVCPDGEKSRFLRAKPPRFHQSRQPFPPMPVTISEDFVLAPLILSSTAAIEYP